MLYQFLKFISRYFFLKIYLQKIKRVNWENIPWDKPVILAANHPATLLDPILLGCYAQKNVHYLAKASLFASKWLHKFFGSLQMIPIKRAMDKGNNGTIGMTYADSFQHCYEVLERNEGIIVFSEGVSIWDRQLHKLQSGTARMAFGAEIKNNYDLDIHIVPISLNYTDITRPFSSVVMVAGEPIRMRNYQLDYAENPAMAIRKVTQKLAQQLSENLCLTEGRSQEMEIEMISEMYFEKPIHNIKVGQEMESLMAWQKNIGKLFQCLKKYNPQGLDFIRKQVDLYRASMDLFHLKDYAFWEKNQSIWRMSLDMGFGFLAFPIFLWGFIHHYPIYRGVKMLAKKMASPIESWAPIMLLLAAVIFPFSYWGYASLYKSFFTHGVVVYLISLPLSAYTASELWYFYKTRGIQWRRIWLKLREPEVYQQIKMQRKKVISLIDNVIQASSEKEI